MLMRTHLAIGVFLSLFFIPYINTNPWIFLVVVLITSILPDIDLMHSYMGAKWYFRPLQWFVKHRGIIHSFTICILLSVLFAMYIPILALPFFLGYGFHLLSDSFTIEGTRPFWPFKWESLGGIRVGKAMETGIFWALVVVDLFLFVRLFFN